MIVQVNPVCFIVKDNLTRYTVIPLLRRRVVEAGTNYGTTAVSGNGRKSYPTIYHSHVIIS